MTDAERTVLVADLRRLHAYLRQSWPKSIDMMEHAADELERLSAALEVYADKENWVEGRSGYQDVWYMNEEGFDLARRTLGMEP